MCTARFILKSRVFPVEFGVKRVCFCFVDPVSITELTVLTPPVSDTKELCAGLFSLVWPLWTLFWRVVIDGVYWFIGLFSAVVAARFPRSPAGGFGSNPPASARLKLARV